MKTVDRMTRIRYIRNNEIYTSHKEFLANNGILVTVQINTVNNTVSIMEVTGSGMYTVVETTSYKTFSESKRIAKALLRKYGVNFFEEVRNRKPKIKSVSSET